MKAFLESFEIGSDEDEQESASDASSEPIINPKEIYLAILDLIPKNIFQELMIYGLQIFQDFV
jgi:hypothetical protein